MRKTNLPRFLALSLLTVAFMIALLTNGGSAQIRAQSTMAATAAAGGGKSIPPFPAKPISLQIIDVAGQKQLVEGIIANYAKADPDKVSDVNYISDTAPNLPGRIKAQQAGGKIDTTLVLT